MDFGLMIGFSLGVVDDYWFWRERGVVCFYGFFCVFVSEEKFWVYGHVRDWIGYWVFGLIFSIYLWFCLVSWIYFLFFWIWWSRFGCWIWIWGLLEIWWRTRRTASIFMKNNESKKNKKFKFCFLIYFLFWFKFCNMAFKKN